MSKPSILGAILVLVGMVAGGGCGSRPAVETVAQAETFSSIIPQLVTPFRQDHCGLVAVRLNPQSMLPDPHGHAPTFIEVKRKKGIAGTETVVAKRDIGGDSFSNVVLDRYVWPGSSYWYAARLLYPDGESAWSVWTRHAEPGCRQGRHSTENTLNVRVILLQAADHPSYMYVGVPPMRTFVETPSISRLEEVFFDDDPTNDVLSFREYFEEVSAGLGGASDTPRMRISGSVDPVPYVMPFRYSDPELNGAADNYKKWMEVMSNAGWPREQGLNDVYDKFIYVVASPAGGGAATFADIRARFGSAPFVRTTGMEAITTLVHEFGHILGLMHHGTLWCPSIFPSYPLSIADVRASCFDPPFGYSQPYGNTVDPMSVGRNHFAAYNKWKLGFLDGDVQWLETTDEGEPGSRPLKPPFARSIDLELFASNLHFGPGYIQMAAVKLLPDDTSLLVDFQVRVPGSMFSDKLLDGTNYPSACPDGAPCGGVFIGLKPGHDLDFGRDTQTPDIVTHAKPIPALELQARDSSGLRLRQVGATYFDPSTCIKIRWVRQSFGSAVVRFTNLSTNGGCLSILPPDIILGTALVGQFIAADAGPGQTWPSNVGNFQLQPDLLHPPLLGGINGVPAIGYDAPPPKAKGYQSSGGESWFNFLHDGTGGTIVLVAQANRHNVNGHLFDETRGEGNKTGLNLAIRGGKFRVRVGNSSGGHLIKAKVSLGAAVTAPHFYIFRYDERRSPKWSLFVDQGAAPNLRGDTVGVPDAGDASLSPAILARSSAQTGDAFDGFLGEMLIVDRYVNDSEVEELAQYLKTKYGIE